MIWVPALFVAAAFCMKGNNWHYGMLMFMMMGMLSLVLIFNAYGNLKLATIIYLLVLNFNIILLNVMFEFNYGLYLYLFPLFSGLSFLFPLPKYKSMFVMMLLIMILFHSLSYFLVQIYPSRTLKVAPESLFTRLNYVFSFSLTFLIFLKFNILKSQQKLELDQKIEEYTNQRALLEETLKDKNILLSEIHHRTKNNLAIVSSMLNLQRNQIDNEQMKDILQDCSNRVHSMAAVHQKLYEKGDFTKIELKDYLNDLIKDLKRTIFPQDESVILNLEIDSFLLTSDKAIPCALILNELLTNSIKYAFGQEGGRIDIKISKISNQVLMMVHDNGKGFEYDSGKNPTSLGMTLIEALAEQLDGHFEFNTKEGTTFTLTFKLS